MTKFVIVSGGVMSGVGKGVASASIAKILQEYGYSVTLIKIDPYINSDAGTLRPTEHGEVWVTCDGGEIDQDLGTYERFINQAIPKKNSITTGQIYSAVIERERRGDYLGATVQFIPHITNEIVDRIYQAAQDYEIVVIEIGGTVGDYENGAYLYAIKNLCAKSSTQNIVHALVTYLPVPQHTGEMKTKPTQQAVRLLNQEGITPDFILCRSEQPIDDIRRQKIESFARIGLDGIIAAPDVTSVYHVPVNFEQEQLGQKILKTLGLSQKKTPDWQAWQKLADSIIDTSLPKVKIAIVGKYLVSGDFSLTDSYLSVKHALLHAGAHLGVYIDVTWLDAHDFEENSKNLLSSSTTSDLIENLLVEKLKNFDGILIPGGFGAQGVDGKINVITYAREHQVPYLGICYGMQLAVIEYARNLCNLIDAHTTEVVPSTINPVVDILPIQDNLIKTKGYGGTMRLGNYSAQVTANSRVLKLYQAANRAEKLATGEVVVTERHRHRYEINPKYIAQLAQAGLIFSGVHVREDDTKLMEFIELPGHPFFVATQAHPEFNSRLESPAPLFTGFVQAAHEFAIKKLKD